MIALDVANTNSQVIDAILDDELFHIILNWNSSNSNWTFGIRNANYEALIVGVSLVVNYPLTKQFRYRQLFPGELMIFCNKDRNGPIPRDGFVTGDYELVYITEEDLRTFDVI